VQHKSAPHFPAKTRHSVSVVNTQRLAYISHWLLSFFYWTSGFTWLFTINNVMRLTAA